jgi:hypothetical protein
MKHVAYRFVEACLFRVIFPLTLPPVSESVSLVQGPETRRSPVDLICKDHSRWKDWVFDPTSKDNTYDCSRQFWVHLRQFGTRVVPTRAGPKGVSVARSRDLTAKDAVLVARRTSLLIFVP